MSMQVRPLFIGYAAGVGLVGAGSSAILTLVLGDLSTDLGSRSMTIVYALIIWLTLIVAGGGAFAAVLFPIRQVLAPSRWWFYFSALLGGVSAVAIATGVAQTVARNLTPLVGRGTWLLACGLTGVAAGLTVVAVSFISKLAAPRQR